jgi:hypothetical protein
MARVERFAKPRDPRAHKSPAAAPARARRLKKPIFNGLLNGLTSVAVAGSASIFLRAPFE